jgi:hypothetical protein
MAYKVVISKVSCFAVAELESSYQRASNVGLVLYTVQYSVRKSCHQCRVTRNVHCNGIMENAGCALNGDYNNQSLFLASIGWTPT